VRRIAVGFAASLFCLSSVALAATSSPQQPRPGCTARGGGGGGGPHGSGPSFHLHHLPSLHHGPGHPGSGHPSCVGASQAQTKTSEPVSQPVALTGAEAAAPAQTAALTSQDAAPAAEVSPVQDKTPAEAATPVLKTALAKPAATKAAPVGKTAFAAPKMRFHTMKFRAPALGRRG
jgi:hypothetical protein